MIITKILTSGYEYQLFSLVLIGAIYFFYSSWVLFSASGHINQEVKMKYVVCIWGRVEEQPVERALLYEGNQSSKARRSLLPAA